MSIVNLINVIAFMSFFFYGAAKARSIYGIVKKCGTRRDEFCHYAESTLKYIMAFLFLSIFMESYYLHGIAVGCTLPGDNSGWLMFAAYLIGIGLIRHMAEHIIYTKKHRDMI